MNTTAIKRNNTRRAANYLPNVAIIMPLHQKAHLDKHVAELTLGLAKEITENYGITEAATIIEKLNHCFSGINYDSNKKTVVVDISHFDEKVIYLDVALDEKVIIDEPFEIRDLVHDITPTDKYLLLVQSAREFRIFLGDSYNLYRIKESIPDNSAAYRNDIPEKIEYFTDTTDRKETLLDKFVHQIDKELGNILNQYKLPVFVLGTERMNGHFKKFTHHQRSILDYISGNYDEAKPHEIMAVVKPHLHELRDIEYAALGRKIEEAKNAKKLCMGIDEVWKNVMKKAKGSLLVVENNYFYPNPGTATLTHEKGVKACENSVFIKDGIDVIIEKVLEGGGEVKFVEPGAVKNLDHIALFLYY